VTRPQTKITVVERLLEAMQRGDPEAVLRLLDSKVEWTPTAWSGDAMYRGREAVHLWLAQFGAQLEHLDIQIRDRLIDGDRGAVRGIVFDTRGERTFAVEVSWSFELENGLLRRGRAHGSWEDALGAAGLDGADG
jgi:ketosteroid isomerase-like protein